MAGQNTASLEAQQDLESKRYKSFMQIQGAQGIFSGLSTIVSGTTQATNAKWGAYLNEANANVIRSNANTLARKRTTQISEVKEAGSKFVSTQISQMAQSGTVVGGAGTEDIIRESDFLIQREVEDLKLQRSLEKNEAERLATEKEISAEYQRKMAKASSKWATISGLVQSAAAGYMMAQGGGGETDGNTSKTK